MMWSSRRRRTSSCRACWPPWPSRNRLATVQYVARSGESCCSEVIAEAGLAMTKSTFSHHLRILREAGVLTKRIQGTKGYTKVRKDDLDRRFPGLIDAIIDAENQESVSRTVACLRLPRHTLLTRGNASFLILPV